MNKQMKKVKTTKARHRLLHMLVKTILEKLSHDSSHDSERRGIKKGLRRTSYAKDPIANMKKLKMYRQYLCLVLKKNEVAVKKESRL